MAKNLLDQLANIIKSGDLESLKKIADKKYSPETFGDNVFVIFQKTKLIYHEFEWGSYYSGTALHYAAYCNKPEIIEFLVKEKKLDVNLRASDNRLYYPIHCAARNDSFEAIKKLVELGADINKKDRYDYTPFDLSSSIDIKDFFNPGYKEKKAKQDLENAIKLEREELAAKAKQELEEAEKAKIKTSGLWNSSNPEVIIHEYEEPNTPYRITNIFNFRARERTVITKDLESGSIAQTIVFFDDLRDKRVIYEAADKLNSEFNGNIKKADIDLAPMRDKITKLEM